jgi:ATP-dependent Lon protease
VIVLTPEEQQYPAFAALRPLSSEAAVGDATEPPSLQQPEAPVAAEAARKEAPEPPTLSLTERHLVVPENSKGWSYRRLFGDYLAGASGIIIRDPYIRAFHQIRNLMEFLRMVNEITPIGDEVSVHLITGSDQESMEKQVENLGQVQDSFAGTSTPFSWEIDASPNFHARSISTNTGWKITLDRGLDLFQWFEFNAFNAAAVVQEARLVKGCEINFIAMKP